MRRIARHWFTALAADLTNAMFWLCMGYVVYMLVEAATRG